MKPYLKRQQFLLETADVEFELIKCIVLNKNYDHIINKIKKIDFNIFRIGKNNKWKSLYNWIFSLNEEELKYLYPNADYNFINKIIKNICKKVVKNEI